MAVRVRGVELDAAASPMTVKVQRCSVTKNLCIVIEHKRGILRSH